METSPMVGMGVTRITLGGLREGFTVVAVSPSGKTMTMRRDVVARPAIDGVEVLFSEVASGHEETARLTRSGEWFCRGAFVSLGGRTEQVLAR